MIRFSSGVSLKETAYCYAKNGFLVRAGDIKVGEEAYLNGMRLSLGTRI
jgi:hypothetical protein